MKGKNQREIFFTFTWTFEGKRVTIFLMSYIAKKRGEILIKGNELTYNHWQKNMDSSLEENVSSLIFNP